MKTMLALSACFVLALTTLMTAQDGGLPPDFEQRLGYQTGTVTIGDNLATITLPPAFRFIGPEGSRRLLTQAWGNPPAAAEGVLGMLVPAEASPLSPEGWGVIIGFEEDGYVDDDDAATLDYAALLTQMQEDAQEANEERQKQGFATVRLVGWAEPPSYDQSAHKMYWAKELAFSDSEAHTLNYSIRILGRRGVLVLNAVAAMTQLPEIKSTAPTILSAIEFNQGHRYADYIPGTDKAAEYGIAGLILGAAATKGGLFKILLAAILAFKKVAFAAHIAVGALVKKLFDRRKATVPPPLPPEATQA